MCVGKGHRARRGGKKPGHESPRRGRDGVCGGHSGWGRASAHRHGTMDHRLTWVRGHGVGRLACCEVDVAVVGVLDVGEAGEALAPRVHVVQVKVLRVLVGNDLGLGSSLFELGPLGDGVSAIIEGGAKVAKVHPYAVHCLVVATVQFTVGKRHLVGLRHGWLLVLVLSDCHLVAGHAGPKKGVDHDVFLVLATALVLHVNRGEARIVQVNTALSVRARSRRQKRAARELAELGARVKALVLRSLGCRSRRTRRDWLTRPFCHESCGLGQFKEYGGLAIVSTIVVRLGTNLPSRGRCFEWECISHFLAPCRTSCRYESPQL